MNPRPLASDSWQDLFMPGEIQRTLYAVNRAGEPFLLLPSSPRLSARALALYPAQTAKARVAKKILHLALRLGFKPGLGKVSIVIAGDDPFWQFLTQTTGLAAGVPPQFAILAGNPRAP